MGLMSNTGNVLVSQSGAITANNISVGRIVTPSVMPANSILQIVQSVKTDTSSTSSYAWSDISGLSVTITPISTTSKIYVMYHTNLSIAAGAYSGGIKLVRNSTDIYLGDAAGSRNRSSNWLYSDYYNYATWGAPGAFLDSPATTSAVTYKLQMISGYAGVTVYVNMNYINGDNTYSGRYPSQITVMEIAG